MLIRILAPSLALTDDGSTNATEVVQRSSECVCIGKILEISQKYPQVFPKVSMGILKESKQVLVNECLPKGREYILLCKDIEIVLEIDRSRNCVIFVSVGRVMELPYASLLRSTYSFFKFLALRSLKIAAFFKGLLKISCRCQIKNK